MAPTLGRHALAAAITLSWSNGPVEGIVNEIKRIKRQMYGRASFETLRARILTAFPPCTNLDSELRNRGHVITATRSQGHCFRPSHWDREYSGLPPGHPGGTAHRTAEIETIEQARRMNAPGLTAAALTSPCSSPQES
ncbi:transposase [Deinococcus aquatilis]|uniref:transposase n=1 Tax=Deinococcus aquatilis TaxID=519440 RepID=UPI00146E503A